jgi:hypothetical protein
LYECILGGIVLLLRRSPWAKLVFALPRPTDTTFHLFALDLTLFLILVPEGYSTVYLIFGRSDFSHSRLSILCLLPLCALFAIYLTELKHFPLGSAAAWIPSRRTVATALGIVLLATVLSWFIQGPVIDQLVPKYGFQISSYGTRMMVMAPVAAKVILTAIILAGSLACLLWKPRRLLDGRIAATIMVATFAFVETVTTRISR